MKTFTYIMGFVWCIGGFILTFSASSTDEIIGWIMLGFGLTWIAMRKDN